MFELWNAIKFKLGRDHCDIQIILAPEDSSGEDKKAFYDRINADGSDAPRQCQLGGGRGVQPG